MLTRQDYKDLAGMLRSSATMAEFIEKLLIWLKNDNPRFQASKFLDALK